MTESSASTRPRQVTLAAGMIMAGSVIVVLTVFDKVTGLQSIETRASIERFLAEPPGSDLGVGTDAITTALRVLSMVAAGCATAVAILGYHVLKRSRAARLGITMLAVPLFLTGFVTGGFLSSLVAASAVLLWLQPARDWFDGVTRPPVAAGVPTPPRAVSPAAPAAPAPPSSPTAPVTSAPVRRPAAVVWACCLTWVCSTVTVLSMVASAVALALEPDRLFDEARRQNPDLASQGVTDDVLATVAYLMIAGIVLWCVAAIVVAVLVFRRIGWARIVLVVSAAVTAALCLVGSAVGAFLLAAPLLASVATLVLLLRADSRPWFERPSA